MNFRIGMVLYFAYENKIGIISSIYPDGVHLVKVIQIGEYHSISFRSSSLSNGIVDGYVICLGEL
jgi:hypothetical protein